MQEIMAWINAQWLEITATGFAGVFAFKTFILDKISFRKKTETYDTLQNKVVALNQTTDVKVELIYEKFELVQAKLDEYIKQNTSLIEQNEQLKNLVVQTLSTSNVPLQAREKFFGGLSETFPSVNPKISDSFKQIIDIQNLAKTAQETVSSKVIDAVSKV